MQEKLTLRFSDNISSATLCAEQSPADLRAETDKAELSQAGVGVGMGGSGSPGGEADWGGRGPTFKGTHPSAGSKGPLPHILPREEAPHWSHSSATP